jgi:hypothetical protein
MFEERGSFDEKSELRKTKTIHIEECGKVFMEWVKKYIVKDGE